MPNGSQFIQSVDWESFQRGGAGHLGSGVSARLREVVGGTANNITLAR